MRSSSGHRIKSIVSSMYSSSISYSKKFLIWYCCILLYYFNIHFTLFIKFTFSLSPDSIILFKVFCFHYKTFLLCRHKKYPASSSHIPSIPDHGKLTYPLLFSQFRVFPPNLIAPNYPIALRQSSFRLIFPCNQPNPGQPAPIATSQKPNLPISRQSPENGEVNSHYRSANTAFHHSLLLSRLPSSSFQ